MFDNPADLTPESVTVTLQDQSASRPLGSGDTGGDTGGGLVA